MVVLKVSTLFYFFFGKHHLNHSRGLSIFTFSLIHNPFSVLFHVLIQLNKYNTQLRVSFQNIWTHVCTWKLETVFFRFKIYYDHKILLHTCFCFCFKFYCFFLEIVKKNSKQFIKLFSRSFVSQICLCFVFQN